MDKLNKLEEFINKLLGHLMALIFKLIRYAIPPYLHGKYVHLNLWCIEKKSNAIAWLNNKVFKFKELLSRMHKWGRSALLRVNSFPFKSYFEAKIQAIKAFILKTPLKSYVPIFSKWIAPNYQKLVRRLSTVKPQEFGILLVAVIMVSGGVLGIYINSNDIFQKEYGGRTPASVQEYDYKPNYLQFEQKTLKVLNVKVPIYAEDIKAIKSVTIDFSVRTTTRFAKYYLEQYEYKLKDYFFSSAEPVISSFALEDEGKDVLKETIRTEINHFLEKENVEGRVEEINILYAIGT